MAEAAGLSTRDWMLDQVIDDAPPLIVADPYSGSGADDTDVAEQNAVQSATAGDELDPCSSPADDIDHAAADSAPPSTTPDVNAGAKRTLVWMGSGLLLVVVLIVVTFLVFGGGGAPAPPAPHKSVTTPAVVAVPTTPDLPAPPQDQAIPFAPTTDSCPGGPTSPLALTDTGTDSAWVCSRGPQESQLDGQILHIKFLCGGSRPDATCSYMVTSLAVTPGWVAKTAGGKDEWLQHRCTTRMQFNFYNGDRLATDPLLLDTNCTHGPVPLTLPGKILASRVEVIILHTERPPAAPQPSAAPGGPDEGGVVPPSGLANSVVGSGDPTAPPVGTDPVDATVAIGQLQFFGHLPN